MTVYTFEQEQVITRPRSDVFLFFSDASNLEHITPGFLHFEILTRRPIPISSGSVIDYRLRFLGVPFRFRSLIESYEPQTHFVDVQLKGPYKTWRHTHRFWDVPQGTMIHDHVEYEIPLGLLGRAAARLFVERTVQNVFNYRKHALEKVFPRSA